ncbi:hypothetical protein BS47DRAFT_1341298, partial [Hydnum rufescens UP504]
RLGLRGLLKAYMYVWGYRRVLSSPRPASCERTSGWRRHSARSMIRTSSLEIG